MITKYILPAVAILGVLHAVRVSGESTKPIPPAQVAFEPSRSPFQHFVAGAGIIEAESENIAVGTFLSGVVSAVSVKPGDRVEVGSPLFALDDRERRAELAVAEATFKQAKAGVLEAQAARDEAAEQFARVEKMADVRAISREERSKRLFALKSAEARVQLALAERNSAEARVQAVQIDLERLRVTSPVRGEVLQVKVRPGEFAAAGTLATPLMLVGSVDRLHVRVDVDENDAWRLQPGAKAAAYVRGNNSMHAPLEFVRFEPFVVPKRSLTGESSERVDTRVLQVLFRMERSAMPVFVGQLVDVFIEADPPRLAGTQGNS